MKGMYDTILCHYDIGAGFWKKALQTKDLDGWMNTFFLDPIGQLFEVDYSDTQDFSTTDPKGYIPNGLRGRVRPYYATKEIEVYPSKWDAHYAPFPRMNITFLHGKLIKISTPGQVRL